MIEVKLVLWESIRDFWRNIKNMWVYLHGLHYTVCKQNRLVCLEYRELGETRERRRKFESNRTYIFFKIWETRIIFVSCYNPGKVIFCEFSVGSLIVHYITMSTFQIEVKP